ncbi:MAG: sodium ion-translocating decarboxylase subunit beta, partial [Spirochaetia bacterium]|nr:sodium ion-translocating decarboxylase subunit beta [Spirochaetia bacterium]
MIGSAFNQLWQSTGLFGFLGFSEGFGWGNLVMIIIGFILLYLAIKKGFEPLLLVPIGFGCILANIPMGFIAGVDPTTGDIGFIKLLFDMGIATGLFPILIFMGVGAMTDFGPLIANPKTLLLGAAAQLGIFAALIGA